MTTAQRARPQVPIAGVPWPVYKLVALAAGFVVLLGVGVVTANPAAAVLTAAGAGSVLWLAFGPLRPRRR